MGTPRYVLARAILHLHLPLPFGLCSAPSIFNNFASALHWVLENNYGANLLHYLDDFLLVGPPDQPTCQGSMSTMLQVCKTMGIPVATEKCEGPATCITFLGIVLDSSPQQLRLPPDKLQEIASLTRSWLDKHKATKRELLSEPGSEVTGSHISNYPSAPYSGRNHSP